jgi:hypothetical protein
LAAFLAAYTSPQLLALITEATAAEKPVPNPSQQLRDVVVRLRNQYISRQMSALLHQLNQAGISEEQHVELLRHQQELRLLKSRPLEG